MADTRHRNMNWNLGTVDPQGRCTFEQIQTAVLLDIRDELQAIRRRLDCGSTLMIPGYLSQIVSNTRRRRRVVRKRKQAA